MRGWVSGVAWGGVAAVVGLAVLSQVMPPPGAGALVQAAAKAPAPDAVTKAAEAKPEISVPEVKPEVEAPEPVAKATEAEPVVSAPKVELAPEADEVAEAAREPEVPPAPAAPAAVVVPQPAVKPVPVVTAPLSDVAPDVVAEAVPSLAAPEADADLPAAALKAEEPAAQPAPVALVAPQADAALAPAAPVATPPVIAARAPAGLDAPNLGQLAADLPQPDATAGIATADPARPLPPGSDAAPSEPDLPPPPPLTPEEKALLAPEPEPIVTAEAEAAPTLPAAPALPDTVAGVTVNRLPRIGDAPPPAATEAVVVTTEPADERPLARFARAFENPDEKPLFAILLIDTGGPALDRTALAALPFPVSFVIDPLAPDAATAAAIYRRAGQEVLMEATGIPEGATAADLEVTFQAHAAALPEAVAVLDPQDGGFQNNRPLASEVVPVIAGQGRGLVTWDNGLNAADQVARRADLPAATVFRRLDGENESAPTIRRYLDRAAFKAAQEGRVLVVGETRPETVAVLLEWSLEGRSSDVALAPVSAVLQTN